MKAGSTIDGMFGRWLEYKFSQRIVGAFTVAFRCLAVGNQMHSLLLIVLKKNNILECHNVFLLAMRNWSFCSGTLNCNWRLFFKFFRALEYIFDSFMFLLRLSADVINEFTIILIRVVGDCFTFVAEKASGIGFGFSSHRRGCDDEMMGMLRKKLDHSLECVISSIPNYYSDYLLRKSVADMEMCVKKQSTFPMVSLLKFLSKSAHSSVEVLKLISNRSDELLLLVCLVRIAHSLVPSLRTSSMICALDQAFEIIVFIHEKIKTVSASNNMKMKVAKDIWINGAKTNHWFQTEGNKEYLTSTISNATNAQVEKLYNDIEELFLELLHSVMDQLPDVIFESLNDVVPFVEFEENVKTSMELVARLNLLEVEPWWFNCSNIYSFMAPEVLLVQKDDESCDNVSLAITGDHVDVN
ncbi:hypothetical protein Syun_030603 [Stephania yunnanensis]|uniref:Uncharacterized protein n=1 Tax=Stephania yunnanensis TaxID=152371 RepID=A0AAP0HFR4_9MAGN